MKKFLWILAGGLLISVAFFLPGEEGNIWQQLFYGAMASAVFLTVFTLFYPAGKETESNKWRVTMATSILFVLFGLHFWLGQQETTKQRQNLIDIRETIETAIAETHVKKILLQTLRTSQIQDNASDLGAVFHTRYDSLITDGRIEYAPIRNDDALRIELDRATEDSVVLVAYSTYVPGEESNFQNYDGQTGHIQTKGILTEKGIEYEREN